MEPRWESKPTGVSFRFPAFVSLRFRFGPSAAGLWLWAVLSAVVELNRKQTLLPRSRRVRSGRRAGRWTPKGRAAAELRPARRGARRVGGPQVAATRGRPWARTVAAGHRPPLPSRLVLTGRERDPVLGRAPAGPGRLGIGGPSRVHGCALRPRRRKFLLVRFEIRADLFPLPGESPAGSDAKGLLVGFSNGNSQLLQIRV